MTSYTFQKEVIGTFEAGGRFIALRMDASYPLPDGRKDVPKALVIVGSEPSSGTIKAHAYTDAEQSASIASRAITISSVSMTCPPVTASFGNKPAKS